MHKTHENNGCWQDLAGESSSLQGPIKDILNKGKALPFVMFVLLERQAICIHAY